MTATTTPRRIGPGRVARIFAVAAAPLLLLATACKPSDVIDPIVDPIEDLFGLNDGEVATPQFEVWNGITIQVVVRIDDLANGVPVTVHVRCEGGTHLSQTVEVEPTGSIGIGETTFTEGWPAGVDCIVSQDIVQGVETVRGIVEAVSSDEVQAVFDNV